MKFWNKLFGKKEKEVVTPVLNVESEEKAKLSSEYKKAELRGFISGCSAEEREVVLVKISYTEKLFSKSGKDISYCHCGSRIRIEERSAIERWIKNEFGVMWRPGEARKIQLSVPKSSALALLESKRSFKYTGLTYALTPSELTEYSNATLETTTTVTFERVGHVPR